MFKKHWVSDLERWFPQGRTHLASLIKVRASQSVVGIVDESRKIPIPLPGAWLSISFRRNVPPGPCIRVKGDLFEAARPQSAD